MHLGAQVGCVACVLGDPSCGSAGDALSADEQRDFFQLIPVPGWGSSSTGAGAFRARARGAVVGSLVADAAAMGVHWVYDLDVLQALADERSASHRQASTSTSTSTPEVGLEFTDPPRSPFYRYASGRNSPYGEQTLVLLHSLAARGGLDCVAYANAFAAHFAEGAFDGYRDVSTKGFLRNFQRGLAPPQTGVADAQANCVARAAPLVLAFAAPADPAPGLDAAGAAGGGRVEGQVRLGRAVRAATRVTQNSEAAGAWGAAGAEVLARVVRDGAAPSAAVRWVASQLEQQIAASRPPDVTDGADGAAPAPPASSDASQQQQQQQQAVESKVELAALVAGHLRQVLALAALPVPEATAKLGRNCHMPAALCTPLHVVLHMEHLAREERRARRGGGVGGSGDSRGQAEGEEEAEEEWDDGLAAAVGARFAQGIRAAIREGGCCASRASYAGALLGALGGEEGGVPAAWRARCTELPRIVEAVDAICLARDRA